MSSPQILIDPAGNSTPTIDCTDVVESIVNKATSKQNDKLDKITNTIEIQQQRFTNIITALTGLTEELKKMHHPQTNPQYQPASPLESQPQNALSHHSSHNASVETWHPSHVSAEAQLPHSAIIHHNTPAGVWCTNNKIVLPNNPEVTNDNTEGSLSLSVHASYLWFKGQNDLHAASEGGSKILHMNLQWKKTKFIGKIA